MEESTDMLLKDKATLTADRRAIRRKQRFPFLMLLPFFIPVVIFVVIPIILVVAFPHEVYPAVEFIGFENYRGSSISGYVKDSAGPSCWWPTRPSRS